MMTSISLCVPVPLSDPSPWLVTPGARVTVSGWPVEHSRGVYLLASPPPPGQNGLAREESLPSPAVLLTGDAGPRGFVEVIRDSGLLPDRAHDVPIKPISVTGTWHYQELAVDTLPAERHNLSPDLVRPPEGIDRAFSKIARPPGEGWPTEPPTITPEALQVEKILFASRVLIGKLAVRPSPNTWATVLLGTDEDQVREAIGKEYGKGIHYISSEYSGEELEKAELAMNSLPDSVEVLSIGEGFRLDNFQWHYTLCVDHVCEQLLKVVSPLPPGLLDLKTWIVPVSAAPS